MATSHVSSQKTIQSKVGEEMSNLTFLAFSSNDEENEQFRMEMFIKSLRTQTNPNWKLLLWDGSSAKKRFAVPRDARIEIKEEEITGNNWNPAQIRNTLSLESNTEIICHVNADVIYAPNFVETLYKEIRDDNIVMCQRTNLDRVGFEKLRRGIALEVLKCHCRKRSKGACGECQCLKRDLFMSRGGYYGLIQDGVSTAGDWKTQACREDCDMWHYFRKILAYKGVKHSLKIKWIENQTWLIHLWHPQRDNKQKWNRQAPK